MLPIPQEKSPAEAWVLERGSFCVKWRCRGSFSAASSVKRDHGQDRSAPATTSLAAPAFVVVIAVAAFARSAVATSFAAIRIVGVLDGVVITDIAIVVIATVSTTAVAVIVAVITVVGMVTPVAVALVLPVIGATVITRVLIVGVLFVAIAVFVIPVTLAGAVMVTIFALGWRFRAFNAGPTLAGFDQCYVLAVDAFTRIPRERIECTSLGQPYPRSSGCRCHGAARRKTGTRHRASVLSAARAELGSASQHRGGNVPRATLLERGRDQSGSGIRQAVIE